MHDSIVKLIGNTPLVRISNYEKSSEINATLAVKLEYYNPAGSVKDRVALAMVLDAEKKGKLKQGSVIIEPTSGNTGVGLASIAASHGYRIILTMPETMSIERRNLLKAYGAELVLTEGSKGMRGAIEKAKEIAANTPDSFMPSQFTNKSNPKIHFKTTGPEIYRQTKGAVDIFVAGVGTGGTITGVGEYLKKKNPNVKIIAVEPLDSAVLSGQKSNAHKIQGIGAGFIPEILNTKIYDEIICVSSADAFKTSKKLSRTEGILVGISSGAALYAATVVAKRSENSGKIVVALLPDSGERYLSTELYN